LKLASDAGQQRDGAMLFRTTLEKALFSSPAACLQTLKERLRKLAAKDPAHPDIAQLRELQDLVAAIGPAQFSKFQHLVDQLQGWHALEVGTGAIRPTGWCCSPSASRP
jgi:hypothetical protein